ncbi:MAG: hypothetical protein MSC30_04180 [Gaiellaceae bacterium MAG52_C11]|nr:hypothetical protein [Candidatus Gaiellasilicea maunaloa]
MDLGLRTVEAVYAQLHVDDEWCVDHERGFTWWGHDLAQSIWAETAFDDDGITVWRVHARTDLVTGLVDERGSLEVLSHLNALGGLSAIGRDPADPTRLQLATSLYVNEDNGEWVAPLFSLSAALQAADAHALATELADLVRGERASSMHPTSGGRAEPDDMLAVVDDLPLRAGGSRFRGDEMQQAADFLLGTAASRATSDLGRLVAELPFGDGVCTLEAETDEGHPRYGAGLRLTLKLPGGLPRVGAAQRVFQLNTLELTSFTRAHFVGSWCLSPDDPPHVTFHAYLPNLIYRPGILSNLLLSMALRARFVERDVLNRGAPV